jgi:hypothetical protein
LGGGCRDRPGGRGARRRGCGRYRRRSTTSHLGLDAGASPASSLEVTARPAQRPPEVLLVDLSWRVVERDGSESRPSRRQSPALVTGHLQGRARSGARFSLRLALRVSLTTMRALPAAAPKCFRAWPAATVRPGQRRSSALSRDALGPPEESPCRRYAVTLGRVPATGVVVPRERLGGANGRPTSSPYPNAAIRASPAAAAVRRIPCVVIMGAMVREGPETELKREEAVAKP